MLYSLIFLWFIRTTKSVLFWVYLWQLKEYHIGRFVDFLKTEKGKKVIFNKLLFVKLLILLALTDVVSKSESLGNILIYSIFVIFLAESLFAFKNVIQKKLRIPVLTKKTSIILSFAISLELLVLSFLFTLDFQLLQFARILLILDVLLPIFSSVLILSFQPLTVILRDQIIRQAKAKREKFKNLLVVGITGSYGKTSVKEFLATILAEKYKVLKTKEHQNSEVGISQCIINELTEEHEVFVVEMGAYNKGGIKLLCDIVQPKIGIVTGANEQHLATFGTMENLLSAEGGRELIESLPEDGLIILNHDSSLIREKGVELYNPNLKNVKLYSMFEEKTDLRAGDIKMEKESTAFRLFSKEGDCADFNLNFLGIHNIYNVLAAACCAKNLGMTLEDIAKASNKIETWQSGMQLKKGVGDLNIVDATYSANPTGVIAHLEYLKVWPGKKVIIMPCLIELGEASERVHKKIGEKIGEVCDLAIITTKDRFKELAEGAGEKAVFLDNAKAIYDKIRSFCGPGDVVLLESRMPDRLIELLIP
jgi:UDP-N-acetylmuramoyl-tripeptide--D-alanyl-D-alanine ligase